MLAPQRAEKLANDTLEADSRPAGERLGAARPAADRAGHPSQLENRSCASRSSAILSHVSLMDSEGAVLGGDGRADWVELPLARRLRRRADARSPASATGVSDRGEPLILAVSSVGSAGGGARSCSDGRSTADLLAPVEDSLGVLFHVETKTASAKAPRTAGSLQEDGTRTIAMPLKLSDPDGASARLLVSMSSRRVSAATWSILMVTGGAGVLVLMVLLGFLQALLADPSSRRCTRWPAGSNGSGRANTRPGFGRRGQELRFLAEGFNDMAATVGSQHRCSSTWPPPIT